MALRRPPAARAGRLRRWGRGLVRLAVGLVGLSLAAVLLFGIVDPRLTPLMAVRWLQGDGLTSAWVPLEAIAPPLRAAVVASEDARFATHWGIDLTEAERAWRDHRRHPQRRPRGASTITMQCARNVYLWPPSRTWVRKGVEIWIGSLMELLWGKRRILEVYLNVAEWGRGLYGAEAAARRYFGVSAAALSAEQAALLAAALPSPRRRDPGTPSGALRARAARIRARAAHVELGPLGR